MTTLQDKLDNIYQTKLEIKSAIGTDSDVFSEYPAMIRSMSGGGVSYSYLDERLSYYVETSDLESMGYATESYVTNAISNIPGVDLSSYVTYTYLESKEYLTEIPATYATYAAIEAMGYATESYVTNAIENIPGTNIKQDIIPESNGTYTLGYEGYYYATTYSYELKMHLQNSIHIVNPYTIGVKVYDTDRYKFTNEEFAPFNTNVVNVNLGSNNSRFAYTYTNNLILGNDNIVDLFPTYSYLDSCGYITNNDLPVINENIIPKENNTYTLGDVDHIYNSAYATDLYMSTKNKISNRSDNQINIMLNNGWKYTFHSNGITPVASQNQNLGTSANPWYATYTSYLYLNGSDINEIFPTYAYVAEHGGGGGGTQEQADWNETNSSYASYIINKPKIYSTTYSTNIGAADNIIYENDLPISNSGWRITDKTSNSITIKPKSSLGTAINFADKGDLIYINNDDVNYITSVEYTTGAFGWTSCKINLQNSIVNWDITTNHIKICAGIPEYNANILSNTVQHVAGNQWSLTKGDTIIGNGLPYLDYNLLATHLLCVGGGLNPTNKYTAFDIIGDGNYYSYIYAYGIGNFDGTNYGSAKDLAYIINDIESRIAAIETYLGLNQ